MRAAVEVVYRTYRRPHRVDASDRVLNDAPLPSVSDSVVGWRNANRQGRRFAPQGTDDYFGRTSSLLVCLYRLRTLYAIIYYAATEH